MAVTMQAEKIARIEAEEKLAAALREQGAGKQHVKGSVTQNIGSDPARDSSQMHTSVEEELLRMRSELERISVAAQGMQFL
jgi:hypothetical protein